MKIRKIYENEKNSKEIFLAMHFIFTLYDKNIA